METVISIKPLLAVLVSAVGAGLILASRKNPNLREGWSLAAGALKFLIVVSMAPVILSGNQIEYTLFTFVPGFDLRFKVDALGLLFATIASSLWIVTTLYSIGYMRSLEEHAQTRYYTCFAVTLSSTMGVALSADLFTLYVFYEILTLVTLPLVGHKETPEAFAGARKYLIYLMGTSKIFLLPAILLTYTVAGTLEFSPKGLFSGVAGSMTEPWMLVIIYFLFLAGFAKAAVMPLHSWLPAAMVAPTPVSALLHAVAVVNTGVFCVLRVIFNVFGPDLMHRLGLGGVTAFLASFTIIMASIYALTQDNLKVRLAYSTISQLSYMVFGAALLTPSGMTGGIIHIANHAFSKITLFFCAGSIYVASHKTNVSELAGIGKKMPWTMAAFGIGTLSMIGVPPVSGFITKWYLAVGTVEAQGLTLLSVLLGSTLLNAGYFVPIVYKAFFESPRQDDHQSHITEPSYFVVVPLVFTAIVSVFLGFYPFYFLKLANLVLRGFG